MGKTIDYFYSLVSPWTYFGGPRLDRIVTEAGAAVNWKPIEIGKVFAVSGGLALPKRAPQRQAYRLIELGRWRDHLGMPLNLAPRFFPASEVTAARLVIAARRSGNDVGRLSNAILRAVWAEERNVADPETLAAIAAENDCDGAALLAAAHNEEITEEYVANTAEAIERGVFGVPTYAYEDELYWGQDRLEFLERALKGLA